MVGESCIEITISRSSYDIAMAHYAAIAFGPDLPFVIVGATIVAKY